MATVKYTLSSRSSNGLSEVHIRFTGGRGVDFRAKSGLFCAPERWNAQKECVIIPRIRSDEALELSELQSNLDELKAFIIKAFLQKKNKVTGEWLKKTVTSFHKKDNGALYFADAYGNWLKNREKPNERVLWRAFQRFELYTNKRYLISDLTTEIIEKFTDYLKNEHLIAEQRPELYQAVSESRKPAPRGENTLSSLLSKMRTFCNECVRNGTLPVSPFRDFKMPQEVYGTPYYITIEERNKLYNTDLGENTTLSEQRDIFVFQCCVGCRVSDLLALKKQNIVNGALEYVAGKTSRENPQVLRVPLNSLALEIVKRYAERDDEKLLPFISSQKYNNYIKEAFTRAGITRLITVRNSLTGLSEQRPINELASSHMARRTFCGNLYKKVKDVRLIGSMSGHAENSRSFSRYSEIDDEMKTELVEMLL